MTPVRLVLALSALLLLPASASASFATLDPSSPYRIPPRSVVYFDAGNGETNTVTVTNGANNALVITDPGSTIEVDGACTVDGTGHVATCTPAEATTPQLSVALGDGNDTFTNNATVPSEQDVGFTFPGDTPDLQSDETSPVFVFGDDGNDVLNGGTANEILSGGLGDDKLVGAGGDDGLFDVDTSDVAPADRPTDTDNDTMDGGTGADALFGGDGTDSLVGGDGDDYFFGGLARDMIDGGAGNDIVLYELYQFDADGDRLPNQPGDKGATITLSDTAATENNGVGGENDSLKGIEDVDATAGADTIVGSNAGNVIYADEGNDVVTGNGGSDNLTGGPDNDTIEAVDQTVDLVDCGGAGGADVAKVDNIDSVRNCTTATGITVTNVPPAVVPAPVVIRDPRDTTKAKIARLVAAKKLKAKTFRRRGRYSFTITSNEAVAMESTLEAKAGKKAVSSKVGYVSLASKSRTLAANKRTKVTLTVKKALRRQFRKRKKLLLTIKLADAGGNVTRRTVTVKLT